MDRSASIIDARLVRLNLRRKPHGATMDPDDVIRDFERLALDDTTELEVDDAIAGLAVLLADPAIAGKERALLTQVGATLYRLGLNERVVAALKKRGDSPQ
uniref:Uncharacterized protein n=2 Tax=Cupriavidus TaxID=106589 RepID=Q46N72_CUPPJ